MATSAWVRDRVTEKLKKDYDWGCSLEKVVGREVLH